MRYALTNLSEGEVNLIASALAGRPWGEVNVLMAKITTQVQQQEREPANPGATKAGPAPDDSPAA